MELQVSASDVLVAVTTVCFDIAGLELYLPLISGAKVRRKHTFNTYTYVLVQEIHIITGSIVDSVKSSSLAVLLRAH